jgi:foldase protein PrsA
MMRRERILFFVLLISLMLCGCKSKEERFELTGYMGHSVWSFERGTKAKLEKEGTSVYLKTNVFQVMTENGKINAVTILKDANDYTICQVKLGMERSKAQTELEKKFGKPISETAGDTGNSITDCYVDGDRKVYISFDADKKTVTGMSCYLMDSKEREEAGVKKSNAGALMAVIGSNRVYYNEAMVYLKSAQEKYQQEYGNAVWKADILGNGSNFGSLMKDEVIKQITELKVICDKAAEIEISLDESELADARTYAKEHYDGLKAKDIDKYLVTKKLLEKVYADNMLANKVFEKETINVDNRVPDSKAKQITVQDIFIRGVNYDLKGKKTELTAEEKEKAYDKVKDLLKQAKETDDFYALAQEASQSDVIEYTFGRGEGPKEYGAAFENASFTLRTGQVSDIITTDKGWHILYCKSDFNKDATNRVKEKIIEQRREDMFSGLYSKWADKYDIVVNRAAWDAILLED